MKKPIVLLSLVEIRDNLGQETIETILFTSIPFIAHLKSAQNGWMETDP
jgi:hypothetical protein